MTLSLTALIAATLCLLCSEVESLAFGEKRVSWLIAGLVCASIALFI